MATCTRILLLMDKEGRRATLKKLPDRQTTAPASDVRDDDNGEHALLDSPEQIDGNKSQRHGIEIHDIDTRDDRDQTEAGTSTWPVDSSGDSLVQSNDTLRLKLDRLRTYAHNQGEAEKKPARVAIDRSPHCFATALEHLESRMGKV